MDLGGKILIILSVIILTTIFMIGLIGSFITKGQCKELCNQLEGTIIYQRIPDGNWFSLRDKCICYFNEGIRTFTLNGGW